MDSANITATLTLSNVAAGSLTTRLGRSHSPTTPSPGCGPPAAPCQRQHVAGGVPSHRLNFNSNFTIATSVSDGVAPAITGVKAMTGTPVNDAPVVDLNAGGAGNNVTTTFTEQTPVLIAPVGTLTDVDSATLSSLLVTLTAPTRWRRGGVARAQCGGDDGGLGGEVDGELHGRDGVLSITGSATTAVYESILQGFSTTTRATRRPRATGRSTWWRTTGQSIARRGR